MSATLGKPVDIPGSTFGDPRCVVGGGDVLGATTISANTPTTSPIIEAVRVGSVTALSEAISQNRQYINSPNHDLQTPLFFCNGNIEMMRELIRSGADVSHRDIRGNSFLSIYTPEVRENLANQLSTDTLLPREQIALQSCKEGIVGAARAIRPAYVDLCSNANEPVTPVDIAVGLNNSEMFSALRRNASGDRTTLAAFNRAFCLAVELGHAKLLEGDAMFIVGFTPPARFSDGKTIQERALELWDGSLENPDSPALRTLLTVYERDRKNPAVQRIGHDAAMNGRWETVSKAAEIGIPFWFPEKGDHTTALHYMTETEPNRQQIERLLTIAEESAPRGNLSLTEVINMRSRNQDASAAALGCIAGNVDAVQLLMEKGAEVHTNFGRHPFTVYLAHMASQKELNQRPEDQIEKSLKLFRETLDAQLTLEDRTIVHASLDALQRNRDKLSPRVATVVDEITGKLARITREESLRALREKFAYTTADGLGSF